MQQSERSQIADEIICRMAKIFGPSGSPFFDASLRAKLIVIGEGIDHAASNAKHPLYISNILPGFGLLVIQAQNRAESVVRRFGDDLRHAIAIDMRVTDSLAHLLTCEMSHADEACLYKAVDGTTYLLFQSKFTAQALELIGVKSEGVDHVH